MAESYALSSVQQPDITATCALASVALIAHHSRLTREYAHTARMAAEGFDDFATDRRQRLMELMRSYSGFHSRANLWASAICAAVICLAT
jgi:hypothetical protein